MPAETRSIQKGRTPETKHSAASDKPSNVMQKVTPDSYSYTLPLTRRKSVEQLLSQSPLTRQKSVEQMQVSQSTQTSKSVYVTLKTGQTSKTISVMVRTGKEAVQSAIQNNLKSPVLTGVMRNVPKVQHSPVKSNLQSLIKTSSVGSTVNKEKSQPVPVVTKVKSQPVPVSTKEKTQPIPVVTKVKSQPVPVSTKVKSQPIHVSTKVKSQPVPVVKKMHQSPQKIKSLATPTVLKASVVPETNIEFKNKKKVEQITTGAQRVVPIPTAIPCLPPISVDIMTQGQLREFIPHMLRIVQGRDQFYANKDKKPEWWPSDIPWTATKTDIKYEENTWTEVLRKIVRSCYKHLGQERSLMPQKSHAKTNHPLLHAYLQQQSSMVHAEKRKQTMKFAEIYICFFCEKEFKDRDKMRTHQDKCTDRPPQLAAVCTPPKHPQNTMVGPPPISPSPKLNLNNRLNKISRENFIQKLDLVPKQKAARMRANSRRSIDIDCSKIDLDEPMSPLSPTTPRTPKSLISQLSRDDAFSGVSKKKLCFPEQATVDNSDKESVASSGADDSDDKPGRSGKSLLMIELTSLLGQRIQNHVTMENSFRLPIVPDAESFCKTPVKNDFASKLRHRISSFPISYKPRKIQNTRYTHAYKFTKRQQREFLKCVNSGLNKESRSLLKDMPHCEVVTCRVSDKLLRKHLSSYSYRKFKGVKSIKPCITHESEFPKEPLLLSHDIDGLLGLKKRSSLGSSPRSVLSLDQCVSEHINAEVSKQKFTLYRCLLTDMSSYTADSGAESELHKTGKSQACANTVLSIKKGLMFKKMLAPESTDMPTSLRKAVSDDNISIISMSSDEESYKSSCCSGCRQKKMCQQVSPNSGSDCRPLPLDVPLRINPYSGNNTCRVIRSPEISPCSSLCLSSPGSDIETLKIVSSKSKNFLTVPTPQFKTLRSTNHPQGNNKLNSSLSSPPNDKLGKTNSGLISPGSSGSSNVLTQSVQGLSQKELELTKDSSVDVFNDNTGSVPSISYPPSPESCPSPSPDKQTGSETDKQSLSLSDQRRILRALRYQRRMSLSLSRENESNHNKSLSPRKRCSSASVCVSKTNDEVEPARRSKRIASSPRASPFKLRRIDTC